VISPSWLRLVTLSDGNGRTVVLKCMELDDVAVERQRRSVPDETIHAIAQERHCQNIRAVGARDGWIGAFLLAWEKRIGRVRGRARPIQVDL
jgi:hypothetical protein